MHLLPIVRHRLLLTGLLLLATAMPGPAHANELLPNLGNPLSQTVSPEKEYKIGRIWIRALRAQVPVMQDPLVQEYTENLIFRLAGASALQDRRLEIVVVEHPQINAFAVPGGIIGVHSGLFLHAERRDEFAAVMAHELAHLSQRHFARQLDQQRRSRYPVMAGILAGLVLAAAMPGSDAGMAVMAGTQAAALDRQLAFSRDNEQEADRLGMRTLVRAGMDPQAFPSMFERMVKTQRLAGERPPEFLLTHPLTESRVSDTRNRAAQYPQMGEYDKDPEYALMKARVQVAFGEPSATVKRFAGALRENLTDDRTATRYGLALALSRASRFNEALQEIDGLLQENPSSIAILVAKGEILTRANRFEAAERLLQKQLQLNPGNYPLSMKYALAAARNGHARQAEQALQQVARKRPDDPNVHYHLAEVRGLAGNIVGVHLSRADYYFLVGAMDEAIEQLTIARQLTRDQYQMNEMIRQRIREVQTTRIEMEQLEL